MPSLSGPSASGVQQQLRGFYDYNSTDSAVVLVAATYTELQNNGLGAFTNKSYGLAGVADVMNATGELTFAELVIGDAMLVRTDFTITPTVNGAVVDVQWQLGTGGGLYTLPTSLGSLANGAGTATRFIFNSYIYAGDSNTYDSPVQLQVKCSEVATVNNAGSAIQVLKG